jgi:adenine/guanine/hypoxanthine permease
MFRPIDVALGLEARGTTIGTEALAGATTFLTMSYILFANPHILGLGGQGLPPGPVLAVTALVAGVSTIAMGLWADRPFALAAGMGLNAVVAFQLVGGAKLTFPEAMGIVVAEGATITLLVLTGAREAVMDAVPLPLKRAIAAGIGLFLTVIGLTTGGLVAPGLSGGPATIRASLDSGRVGVFALGLALTAVLVAQGRRGALLIGILATTAIAIAANALVGGALWDGPARLPVAIVALPDLSLLGQVSFGFVAKLGVTGAFLAVFTLMLADFFDTMGTAIALGGSAGFLDAEGRLPGIRRVLLVDSLAALFGGLASSSSATTYIESASGIAAGGRTGLASVVTGGLFLAAMLFSPLAGVVPPEATAPALVLVGFLMMDVTREIDWKDHTAAIPAFLAMVAMPATWSITDGIGAGFVSWTLLQIAGGRIARVHPLMAAASGTFLVYFALEPLRRVLG